MTDGTWTYTWQNGRELATMSDGTVTWRYTYDANGMRTSRSNGTKTYNYVYNGSQLTQMTVGNDTMYFTYDILGPTTVTWNGETYYYALNGQGDATGIFDESGTMVVFYNWDNAWGYHLDPEGSLVSTLGTLNPLRYRSYVYDTETGYYYLQSRYYDPEIGRFINVDAFVTTGQGFAGNNMFAYCNNNPVSLCDPAGNLPFLNTRYDTMMLYGGSGITNYSGGASSSGLNGNIIQDAIDYLTNTDERVVLESKFLSFYHGVPVFRANIGEFGGGFSFGLIVMDDFYQYDDTGIKTLKHEYGHKLHMDDVGPTTYFFTTAVPSLIGAGLSNLGALNIPYYSLPWEYVANMYGKVDYSNYTPWADSMGSIFWCYTIIVSKIMGGI